MAKFLADPYMLKMFLRILKLYKKTFFLKRLFTFFFFFFFFLFLLFHQTDKNIRLFLAYFYKMLLLIKFKNYIILLNISNNVYQLEHNFCLCQEIRMHKITINILTKDFSGELFCTYNY